ncbi:hypothetical protein OBBRIDRAFT_886627, partial [Obba rivulosa]
MGYDSTCFISGYPVASSLNHVMMDYRDDLVEARLSGVEHNAYSAAMDRLLQPYTEEDELTRRDMVLLGPFTPEDAYIHPLDVPREPVDAVRAGLIRAIHDVMPGEDPGVVDEAIFTARATGLKYDMRARRHLTFVNAAALHILALAVPALTVQRLWALKMKFEPWAERGIGGIDYGPVDQGGHYVQLHSVGVDARFDEWMVELMKHGEPTEDDRQKMMMGAGNMWVFVRPDLFPVAEAFAAPSGSAFARLVQSHSGKSPDNPPGDPRRTTLEDLPLDILLLICSRLSLAETLAICASSRRLFLALHPGLDSTAYTKLSSHERWYLPPEEDAGPWGHDRRWFEDR